MHLVISFGEAMILVRHRGRGGHHSNIDNISYCGMVYDLVFSPLPADLASQKSDTVAWPVLGEFPLLSHRSYNDLHVSYWLEWHISKDRASPQLQLVICAKPYYHSTIVLYIKFSFLGNHFQQ